MLASYARMSTVEANLETYGPGYDATFISSLSHRTVDNSAAYLMSYIRPDMTILDVGCGPGSITLGFAKLVPNGKVIGLDADPRILDMARTRTGSQAEVISNAEFAEGDALALPFPDDTFDICHSHQLLQHVADQIQVLREMRRVTKPGGLVACREGDRSSTGIGPVSEMMRKHMESINRVTADLGGEPWVREHMQVWACRAGFEADRVTLSTGIEELPTRAERKIWAGLLVGMATTSRYASLALEKGYVTKEELSEIVQAWKHWADDEGSYCKVGHVEMICRV